jgi:hypothetical protein
MFDSIRAGSAKPRFYTYGMQNIGFARGSELRLAPRLAGLPLAAADQHP